MDLSSFDSRRKSKPEGRGRPAPPLARCHFGVFSHFLRRPTGSRMPLPFVSHKSAIRDLGARQGPPRTSSPSVQAVQSHHLRNVDWRTDSLLQPRMPVRLQQGVLNTPLERTDRSLTDVLQRAATIAGILSPRFSTLRIGAHDDQVPRQVLR